MLKDVLDNSGLNKFKFENAKLSAVLSSFLEIAFFLAAFMAFIWLVWGAFAYIMAQGQKENLAKARAKITWAIIGLMIVLMAYFITTFVYEIFKEVLDKRGGVPF
ncbi:MAG: hypothetical protein Q7R77_00285 [Candidatus Daviesbacteria bacterium]|nr:hypothetical protein [Candidatus Daviesbacteria bacterium]